MWFDRYIWVYFLYDVDRTNVSRVSPVALVPCECSINLKWTSGVTSQQNQRCSCCQVVGSGHTGSWPLVNSHRGGGAVVDAAKNPQLLQQSRELLKVRMRFRVRTCKRWKRRDKIITSGFLSNSSDSPVSSQDNENITQNTMMNIWIFYY